MKAHVKKIIGGAVLGYDTLGSTRFRPGRATLEQLLRGLHRPRKRYGCGMRLSAFQ